MECLFCQARERMEHEAREAGARELGDRYINLCECGGVKRFIVYGLYPTTPAEFSAFFSDFMGAFEYPSKWKKTWPTFAEVVFALEKYSTLDDVAEELTVSTRTLQEIVKVATGGGNFRQYQAEKASREKSRLKTKLWRRRR
jgi:hypothetical protein